ncbi:MAG: type II secretion system protein GspG [Phycisphaerae bacterium]
MHNRNAIRRGFTLIEVLLVLVILVGIGAIAVVALTGSREGANIDMTRAKMTQIMGGLEKYRNDFNALPEEGDLQPLVRLPEDEDETQQAKWKGPYVEADRLTDAWGNEIVYSTETDTSSGKERTVPVLTSYGPDGVEGTDDDIVMGRPEEE